MPGLALAAAPLVSWQRPLPSSEFDYVDWSWQRWRELTGERSRQFRAIKPDKRSSSSSPIAHRLSPCQLAGATVGLPENPRRLSWYPADRKAPLNPKLVDEAREGNIVRRTVEYRRRAGRADFRVPSAAVERWRARARGGVSTSNDASWKERTGRLGRKSRAAHGTAACRAWIRHADL